jgi:hypothetical protein
MAPKRAMSPEHKATLAKGREAGRAVRDYLVVRRGFSEVGQLQLIGEQLAGSAARTHPINLPTDH